jgi:hypothetical protein
MKEAVQRLIDNKTFIWVKRKKGTKLVTSRWVYKLKSDYSKKARVAMRGFLQILGEHYDETTAPVADQRTNRLINVFGFRTGRERSHFDVKSAFQIPLIDFLIHAEPPQGLRRKDQVWQLLKTLEGLKQGSRQWWLHLKDILMNKMGFRQAVSDQCCFTRGKGRDLVIVLTNVDDLLVVHEKGQRKTILEEFRLTLPMKDEGTAGDEKHYLGMEIVETAETLTITQQRYTEDMMKSFDYQDARPAPTPELPDHGRCPDTSDWPLRRFSLKTIIGKLLWLARGSRGDLSEAVARLATFTDRLDYKNEAYVRADRILRFLRERPLEPLVYYRNAPHHYAAFCDSDFAGDRFDRKSQEGFCGYYGGGLLQWWSRKQKTVSLSSTEAELGAEVKAAQEIVWMINFFTELGFPLQGPIDIHADNFGAICLAKNHVIGKNTKHVDTRYHFVNEAHQRGLIRFVQVPSKENRATFSLRHSRGASSDEQGT